MKKEVKTPVLVGVIVIVVGGIVLFAMKYVGSAGDMDHGQIAYTPGVPPWEEKDPAKKAAFRRNGLETRDNANQAADHAPPALIKTDGK